MHGYKGVQGLHVPCSDPGHVCGRARCLCLPGPKGGAEGQQERSAAGLGSRQKTRACTEPWGWGSQLNGWRMKRRALGGDVRREGFFHTMAKGIIVLRRRADPDVGLRLLHDRIGRWRLVGGD